MKKWIAWMAAGLTMIMAANALAQERKPSLLICTPWETDLGYMADLSQAGFQVDYVRSFAEVTWDRITNYNALIIYMTPDAYDVDMSRIASSPAKVKDYVEMIERYLDAGGGVFLMPEEYGMLKQSVADLTDRWGAKLPAERIEETGTGCTGELSRISYAKLALTGPALPSPVSEGVKQVWYPICTAYAAAHGGPIWVDKNWQVVLKGSPTSETRPIDTSQMPLAVTNPVPRPAVKEPPLFAIRELKAGRVALVNQWCQYSFGAGTKWLFNREVLSRGVNGRPSDFGRLLENTLRWLAEPSLKNSRMGGYVMDRTKLMPPNYMPEVKDQYGFSFRPYAPEALGSNRPPANMRLYRGLIGAKTAYSTGQGSVEDYARAAAAAKLDFVVFLEDFAALTPEKFQKLKDDCRRLSYPAYGDSIGKFTPAELKKLEDEVQRRPDAKVLLVPGFAIESNVGNHLFFFGLDPILPPDLIRTGPNKSLYYMQQENGKGGFTGLTTPHLDWILQYYHRETANAGYYNFAASPHGMKLSDCRLYSLAGVRYYRDGKLVEDVTDEYLTAAQSTIPPGPVAIHEVSSPAALAAAAGDSKGLTFAQAGRLCTLVQEAFPWTTQYSAVNIFPTDGPLIRDWPGCHRVITYGGEEFVAAAAVMPSPISVSAEKGLKEVRIYNGRDLYRRFALHGTNEWNQTLVLDGTVQKNLVLVAEDMAGGKALSYARRCWKDGALAPVFCSDHVNDGGHNYLTHGPNQYQFNFPPSLPLNMVGGTWDGGPTGSMPLGYQSTVPQLYSDKGEEWGARFNQTPLLEFSDEGAVAIRSPRREVFDARFDQVYNAWNTYGPLAGPSRLFDYTIFYREYVTPTVDVPHSGWAGPGVRVGVNPSLFLNEMVFKEDLKVVKHPNANMSGFWLGTFCRRPHSILVIGSASERKVIRLSDPIYEAYPVGRGDWFGVYSEQPGNSHLFINRGEPIRIMLGAALIFMADKDDKTFRKGDRYRFEVAALGFPPNVKIRSADDFQRYVDYLRSPEGLLVLRGRRVEGPGLVELAPENHAVELSIPFPAQRLDLTLPVRIQGLNTRWSAGLLQKVGYSKGFYGTGENRYRALGLDLDGNAYVPLYVDYAAATWIVAGHPVAAGPEGKDLFIQLTKVGEKPDRWHVSANNPTDQPVTTTLRKTMDVPGLDLKDTPLTLQPGEYKVIM